MGPAFSEAVPRSADAPLRQGDVIEAVSDQASQWTRHLLVITADCDLANQKNAGRITCIPLLSAEDYLLSLLLPEHREKAVQRLATEFNDELRRHELGRISPSRVVEWVLEADTDDIIDALELSQEDSAPLRRACDGIRLASRQADSLQAAIKDLIAAQLLHVNPKSEANLLSAMRDVLASRFKQPPGDSLFLKQIAPGYDTGYFAYLRHIEQVWEPEVALSSTRIPLAYRRIGALSDRFTHAVVQRFAMVFMPIGLPTDYEESRNSFANDLGRLAT